MAKRRKFSRWRRLPGVYRFGDEKAPNPNLEPERLSLYISGQSLDRAEAQAHRLGFETVQEYCGELLVKAIEAEHVREHVAGVEAKRGALEGLHEIADDPDYLAELTAASTHHDLAARPHTPAPEWAEPDATAVSFRLTGPQSLTPRELSGPDPGRPKDRSSVLTLSPSALVVLRHAGQPDDDPQAFLPCLRRGNPVPASEVGELAQALHDLEVEYRDTPAMDRRLTFALHRLAFESQILHTDAWPGSFDVWTVDMLRAVQEAVERILSGQDIRYYPDPDAPSHLPSPETTL